MSTLWRNVVKIPLVQLSAQKFRAGTVELVLDQFGLLGTPWEWATPCAARVGVGSELGSDARWARARLWLRSAHLGLRPLKLEMSRLGPSGLGLDLGVD
ncbi:hypothetical protein COP2_018512 [Malus domestica]